VRRAGDSLLATPAAAAKPPSGPPRREVGRQMMASFSASSRSRTLARVTGAAGITTLVVVLGTSLATDVVTSANTSVGDTTGPPCRRTPNHLQLRKEQR